MQCESCSTSIADDSRFCPHCGAPVQAGGAGPRNGSTVALPPKSRDADFIGPFRIIRELGRGGMGVVYEAEQQNPVRLVALKVIQGAGFVDAMKIRLFQREAQALARMKHPGIATIYESGCTEDGRHFFAMELVRGETLREYLDRENAHPPLDHGRMGARLRLFIKICDAVSYAHQRGIVHRDLKPANILVPAHGSGPRSGDHGIPEVKILDFGLARITDADMALGTLATSAGEVVGTLPYMSPEQFRGDPEGIDTRTDIFSLGVILFEMLAGRLPLDLSGKNLPEAARMVCEQPAPPLGTAWLGAHRPDPDLATIVGKNLEKDPSHRYQSVGALADDLDRYLQNQPIIARPPSTFYHLRKAFLRHKASFAFAAALLVLLTGSSVSLAIFSARARAARDEAEREAARANAIKDFLMETMGSANPIDGKKRDITVLEALKTSSARIGPAFASQPDVEANLRFTIGTTYMRLGAYEEAEEMVKDALRLWTPAPGKEDMKAADACNVIGILRQERGDLPHAETWFRRALDIKRRYRPVMDADEAGILSNLSLLLKDRGRLAEAESLIREVLVFDQKTLGNDHLNVAIDLNNLGSILLEQGTYGECEANLREAEAIFRRHGFAGLPVTLGNLGEAMVRQGRGAQAEPILAEAVRLGSDKLGDLNQDVAKIRVKHGECLASLGRLKEAQSAAAAALPVLEHSLGGDAAMVRRAKKLLDTRTGTQDGRRPATGS